MARYISYIAEYEYKFNWMRILLQFNIYETQ